VARSKVGETIRISDSEHKQGVVKKLKAIEHRIHVGAPEGIKIEDVKRTVVEESTWGIKKLSSKILGLI